MSIALSSVSSPKNDVCNMWQMWLLCGKWNDGRLPRSAWGRSTVASQGA